MKNHSICCSFKEYRNNTIYRNEFADHFKKRRKLWHDFTADNLPKSPGCYVLYFDGVLSYIGSTENLRARISKHLFVNPEWKGRNLTIKAKLPRRFGEWAMTEIRLIRKLCPVLNKIGKLARNYPSYP